MGSPLHLGYALPRLDTVSSTFPKLPLSHSHSRASSSRYFSSRGVRHLFFREPFLGVGFKGKQKDNRPFAGARILTHPHSAGVPNSKC